MHANRLTEIQSNDREMIASFEFLWLTFHQTHCAIHSWCHILYFTGINMVDNKTPEYSVEP